MSEIETLILETLSFFDPLTKEQIYLQVDEDRVKMLAHLTNEDLDKCLKNLKKAKRIKSMKVGKDVGWVKVYPKRPWYKKLMLRLESLIGRT